VALSLACQSVPPLAHTFDSPEALGNALLDALARRDRARLDEIAVSEQEFRDHVWPDLPAARPERNLPFSYVWGDLHQKSRLNLSNTLAEHGGTRFELRRVRFLGPTTQYGHSAVHRKTALDAVDPSGNPVTLQLCGSLIHKDGGWKVFSYVVDD
jgi:hypothetical protein